MRVTGRVAARTVFDEHAGGRSWRACRTTNRPRSPVPTPPACTISTPEEPTSCGSAEFEHPRSACLEAGWPTLSPIAKLCSGATVSQADRRRRSHGYNLFAYCRVGVGDCDYFPGAEFPDDCPYRSIEARSAAVAAVCGTVLATVIWGVCGVAGVQAVFLRHPGPISH
jgi:hypothetical protein